MPSYNGRNENTGSRKQEANNNCWLNEANLTEREFMTPFWNDIRAYHVEHKNLSRHADVTSAQCNFCNGRCYVHNCR